MARHSDAGFVSSLFRDKTFQLHQIRRVLGLVVFFVVQSTIVLGIFYYMLMGRMVAGNAPLLFASEDMGTLASTIPSLGDVLGQWLIVMSVVNAAITIAIAVYILRKLGNPVMALRRALNEVGDGNLNVKLRAEDSSEFGELCQALNNALEQVNTKISVARELTKVSDVRPDQPAPDNDTLLKAISECGDVLSYFDKTSASNDDSSNRNASAQT